MEDLKVQEGTDKTLPPASYLSQVICSHPTTGRQPPGALHIGQGFPCDVGFTSVYYEYLLLLLVNKKAALACGRAE